ncbi:hypothetical protein Plhal304r1_c011g0042881 [Plasmopara halstedii]
MRTTDETLSILTFIGTLTILTFIGSNKNCRPLEAHSFSAAVIGANADGFTAILNRIKRSRKDIDFTTLLMSHILQPLGAASNYLQSLQSMEVRFVTKDITTDKSTVCEGDCTCHIKRPKSVESSTESAFFIVKHHTKI